MSSQVRESVSRYEMGGLPVTSKPLGLSKRELAAAILVAILLILVVVYYFVSLRPEQERLQKLEAELASQQDILMKTMAPSGEGGTANVDTSMEALDSLEIFKGDHLQSLSKGRISLIEEINALARKNSVNLATGLDMRLDRPEEETDRKVSKKKKEEQKLNIFPRILTRFTVVGQYPNMRAFINDIDHNKHFMVIHSITLASVEQTTEGSGRGRTTASTGLSLSIELSAYFQP